MAFAPFISDLDAPLLKLSPQGDVLAARAGATGIHFWGHPGGGKTTAAHAVAGAYLRAGFGGYVTAAKFDEIPLWQRYAHQHGRSNSLILFDENEGYNFLDHQMAMHGMDGIGTVVECLMRVIEAARRASGTASHSSGRRNSIR